MEKYAQNTASHSMKGAGEKQALDRTTTLNLMPRLLCLLCKQ